MVAGLVSAFLSTALTSAVMWLLSRTAAREPDVEGDAAVLRHGWGTTVLGVISLGVGGLMLAGLLAGWGTGQPLADVLLMAGVGAAFGVAGLWFLGSARTETVWLTADGVVGRSGFGRRLTSLQWHEVEQVQFSRIVGYVTLAGPGRQRVRVSMQVRGADDFMRVVERKVRVKGADAAYRAYWSHRPLLGGTKR